MKTFNFLIVVSLISIVFAAGCIKESGRSSVETGQSNVIQDEKIIMKSAMEVLTEAGYTNAENLTNGPSGEGAGAEDGITHDNSFQPDIVHISITLYRYNNVSDAKNYYNQIVKDGPLPQHKQTSVDVANAICYAYDRDATVLYYFKMYCEKNNFVMYFSSTTSSDKYTKADVTGTANKIISKMA